MVVAAVDAEEVEAYNELIRLDPADLVSAGRIEWRMQSKLRKQPGSSVVQIVLIEALLQQGKAGPANLLSDAVWHTRTKLSGRELDAFSTQLFRMGQYERSMEIMSRLSGVKGLSADEEFARRLSLAWLSGDFGTFKALIAVVPDNATEMNASTWRRFCERIDELGFGPLLCEQQAFIHSVMAGRQVDNSIIVLCEDDEDGCEPELLQQFYIAAPYAERARIGDELHEGLRRIYAAAGRDNEPFWELMTPMVMDVTARVRRGAR